jgi:DNA-directed RNA polymerase I subunit RPA43
MRYTTALGGVPTHIISAALEERSGAIVGDAPGVNCSAKANYMVFAPQPGQLLIGEVNAVSSDHIGMLIYNNWNASIPRAHIPAQYEYDHEVERWCDRDFDSPLIEEGSAVSFAFQAFEMGGDGAFSVIGSLATPHTGLVPKAKGRPEPSQKRKATDDASEAAVAHSGKPDAARVKGKKRKKVGDVDTAQAGAAEETEMNGDAPLSTKKKSKKKTKEKAAVDSPRAVGADTAAVDASSVTKKKNKKKKKQLEA